MEGLVMEWLELFFRWLHVITGIAWIGSSFYFNWLDLRLERPLVQEDGKRVEGELWMVHSGGFYQVVKQQLVPDQMPETLHWFKWEAAFTWISGVFLLAVVYYMGGGVLMTDPTVSDLSTNAAIGLGLGTLVGVWLLYDLLWISPIAKMGNLAEALTVLLLFGVVYFLTEFLSGRAAFLHVGATMGTCMAANVWVRILPAQRSLIAATESGGSPDPTLAKRAKERSRHNNYMTLPVVFIMVSNHFPGTYGHAENWLVLILLMIAGASVRHLFNTPGHVSRLAVTAAVLAIGSYLWLSAGFGEGEGSEEAVEMAADAGDETPKGKPIDPATAGVIQGVVLYKGEIPAPREFVLKSGCGKGTVSLQTVQVTDGKLKDVFVWIRSGLDGWAVPEAPESPVDVDQKNCLYVPRVSGARTGQEVRFLNSDPLMHNVNIRTKKNRNYNLNMSAGAKPKVRRFRKAQAMVTTRCDVHPWMSGFIGVSDHPFFAVTGADGSFSFEGLPPGEYRVEAWHEVHGVLSRDVTLEPRGKGVMAFDFTSP